MRKNRLFLNTLAGVIQQIITVVSGLIIPRLILSQFGSATNGLISSITQFLSLISLCDLGVGAVVQSALYKPLADKDDMQISRVVKSANRFFRKIAMILLVYVAVLMLCFPYISNSEFEHWFTASLIAIIAINSLTQFFFSIVYKLLLNSAQLCYVHMGYNVLSVVLSTIISAIMLMCGCGIHSVKLAGAACFLIQPIAINIYVSRHFAIDKKVELQDEPIKQKWNGLAQHFATVIVEHSPTTVLTIFSTLENVSVYAVYHMVINGIRQLILSAMSGVKSFLGTAYASCSAEDLKRKFNVVEWVTHSVVTLLFTVMGVLIVPFVKVYTADISDAEYIVPVFAFIMVIAQGIYCIRLPYNFMIQAAGHYKETQASAIIETVINIVSSVLLVSRYGLVGIAVGTLVSISFRTLYFVCYLSKRIVCRSAMIFAKNLCADIVLALLMVLATNWIQLSQISYWSWFAMAIEVFAICTAIVACFNLLFYRDNMIWLIKQIRNKLK